MSRCERDQGDFGSIWERLVAKCLCYDRRPGRITSRKIRTKSITAAIAGCLIDAIRFDKLPRQTNIAKPTSPKCRTRSRLQICFCMSDNPLDAQQSGTPPSANQQRESTERGEDERRGLGNGGQDSKESMYLAAGTGAEVDSPSVSG